MSKQRTTFGKLQRERDKKAKLAAKRERRLAAASDEEPEPRPVVEHVDEQALLTELAELHQRYEDGAMDLEEFEARRDQLRQRLDVS